MNHIVATGVGVISPKVENIKDFLNVLQTGENTLKENNTLMPHEKKSTILGIVENGLEEYQNNPAYKRYSKAMLLGIKAAKEAIASANIDLTSKRVGLFVGTAIGGISEEGFLKSIALMEEDPNKMVTHFIHFANHHSLTSANGHDLGIKGIEKTISTGCTSSLEAIEIAMLYLKNGLIDVAVVGGVDSAMSKTTNQAFIKNRSITINQTLEEGAIPFSKSSRGFAIAEAAAFLILEREEDALKRNVEILGEIEQVISNNDGIGAFSTDTKGEQLKNLVQQIAYNRKPDYVNSQALGIQINDQIEKRCSKEVFNHEVPYTSIKAMVGNPFGAAGAIQVISGLLSIKYGFIPPTTKTQKLGYEEMFINTDIQYKEINEVLVTNHGLGGNNAVAYLKKV